MMNKLSCCTLIIAMATPCEFLLIYSTVCGDRPPGLSLVQLTDQEVYPTTIQILFRDSAGNELENVEAWWFHAGKAQRLNWKAGGITLERENVSVRGLIVVRKEGYQHSGQIIDATTPEQVTLVLGKENEPGRVLEQQPFPLDEKTRQKVIAEIADLIWVEVDAFPDNTRALATYLPALVKLQPERTRDYVEAGPLPERVVHQVYSALVRQIAKSDPKAAVEIADSVEEPTTRWYMFYALLRNLKPDDPLRQTCEDAMIAALQSLDEPQLALGVWAEFANYYRRTGRPELARVVIDRHLEQVEKLPSGGWPRYPRSLFAALIVNEDPERALELIENSSSRPDDSETQRAYARLAFDACHENPEFALKLLEQIPIPTDPSTVRFYGYHSLVCQWMVARQSVAAIKMVDSFEQPVEQMWAYGLMTKRLALQDADAARQVLRKIDVAKLEQVDGSRIPTAPTAAGLLPLYVELLPEQAESKMWHAVWLAVPKNRWNKQSPGYEQICYATAMAIARYDREVAIALAESATPPKSALSGDRASTGSNSVINAMDTMHESRETLVAQLALNPDYLIEATRQSLSGEPTHQLYFLAKALIADESEFWEYVSRPELLLGLVDTFENYDEP